MLLIARSEVEPGLQVSLFLAKFSLFSIEQREIRRMQDITPIHTYNLALVKLLFIKTRPTIKYKHANVRPIKTSRFLRVESWSKAEDLTPSTCMHKVGIHKCPLAWTRLNHVDFQSKESCMLLPFCRLLAGYQSKIKLGKSRFLRTIIITLK